MAVDEHCQCNSAMKCSSSVIIVPKQRAFEQAWLSAVGKAPLCLLRSSVVALVSGFFEESLRKLVAAQVTTYISSSIHGRLMLWCQSICAWRTNSMYLAASFFPNCIKRIRNICQKYALNLCVFSQMDGSKRITKMISRKSAARLQWFCQLILLRGCKIS